MNNKEQKVETSTKAAIVGNTALAAGWISVDDKLPELGTRCLIVESDGFIEICNYCKSFWNHPRNSVGFLNEQDEQPSMCHPTHWMPLPEPPAACR